MVPGKSPEWLPPGFSEKVKVKEGRKYKVYTDLLTGSKFYSKPAVTRYLDTISKRNTVVEQAEVENVEQSFSNSDISASQDSLGCIPEKKREGKYSFETVTNGGVSAGGIPLGWIKETKTTKSGNKIRKDLPSSPVDEKLSKHRESSEEPSILGKVNGGRDSSPKSLAAPEARILVQTQDDSHISGEIKASEILKEVDAIKVSFESADEGSEELRVTNPELAMAESITKKELPLSEIGKRTDTASVSSKKSKKKKGVNLPSRTSKRLAGYEPEVQSNFRTSERTSRAAAKRSSIISIKTLPNPSLKTAVDAQPSSNINSSEEATLEVIEEKSHDVGPSENIENHQSENQAVPHARQGDDSARSLESHQCIEISKSWSDPCLEFAFKTLTEEISFEDTLAISGCFGEKLAMPYNQLNNCLKPLEPDVPHCFQKGILPRSESLKEKGAAKSLPTSNTDFLSSGVSSQQSSTEGRFHYFPNLPESATEKQTGNAQASLRRAKKKPLSFSSGVSVWKGSSGLGKKMVPNTVSGEQVPRTSLGLYSGHEVKSRPCSSIQTAYEVSQSHVTNQSKERKTGAFSNQEILQKAEPMNRSVKLSVENQAISDEKRASNSSKSQESLISYTSQNTWSDPCLEFAFKTLTGELPIEDSLAFPSDHLGNQFGIPFSQANLYFKPPRADASLICQGKIHHSDPLKQNRFADNMPSNVISFPNNSSVSSQQSSSEIRNRDYLNNFNFRK